jgi:hypothetical protein
VTRSKTAIFGPESGLDLAFSGIASRGAEQRLDVDGRFEARPARHSMTLAV